MSTPIRIKGKSPVPAQKRIEGLDLSAARIESITTAAIVGAIVQRRTRRPASIEALTSSEEHAAYMLKRAHTRMRRAATIAKKWQLRLRSIAKRIAAAKAAKEVKS